MKIKNGFLRGLAGVLVVAGFVFVGVLIICYAPKLFIFGVIACFLCVIIAVGIEVGQRLFKPRENEPAENKPARPNPEY